MVLEALQAADPRRAMLAAAIKVFILQKYPTVNTLRLPHLLRRALDTGLSRGLLARPPNSKARGATGSFKLVPKDKRKAQPRKPATSSVKCPQKTAQPKKGAPSTVGAKGVPRKPGEATTAIRKPAPMGKAPKQPRKPSTAPPDPGQAGGAPRRPGGPGAASSLSSRAKEKPPRKGPPLSGQASKAPSTGRVKTTAGAQGSSKIHAGSQGTQATTSKHENRARKTPPVPKEAAARDAELGPQAKATLAPKEPAAPAGKTSPPRSPKGSGGPPKSTAPRAPSRKAKAEG
ncbi:histone H1.8-like isoform X1 [Erinaceus europaeus]|uniref:Histone H1.8-like isoform X1 n=1 Tax=Erinaceus europaeus TaxID=9365 RepID=A0ABM3WI14_ERIEU|nr:histone H1.8-like isoform X1 [Erinaceus europaeus]